MAVRAGVRNAHDVLQVGFSAHGVGEHDVLQQVLNTESDVQFFRVPLDDVELLVCLSGTLERPQRRDIPLAMVALDVDEGKDVVRARRDAIGVAPLDLFACHLLANLVPIGVVQTVPHHRLVPV